MLLYKKSTRKKDEIGLKFNQIKYKGCINMKIILLSLSILLCLSLSACAVHTPRGSVVIDPDGYDHRYHRQGGKGDFCPPGLAKQGRC